MSILPKFGALAAVAAAAGIAIAAVKFFNRQKDDLEGIVYTTQAGEFPDEDTPHTSADCAPETASRPFCPEASLPSSPNQNPVDAAPVTHETDPKKIADPADFQDWE